MTLTSAINSAKNVFSNSGEQSAVISKNIANSGSESYVKRSTVIMTTQQGATVMSIDRATNSILQQQMFLASSDSSGQEALLEGLGRLQSILGGNDYELAPSTYISELFNSIQEFASKPGEMSLAQTTISAAGDVANSLNKATASIQAIRADMDADIANAVTDLNDLLVRLEQLNSRIVGQTATGADPNDALDLRDQVLSDISEIVGITVQYRANNDIVLYTADGTTLFETIPRTVSFARTTTYDATVTGGAVYIDGTAVELGVGGDTSASGSLAGLLQLRDEIAPTFQSQIDEIARALVTVFAETDPSAFNPDMPGLFTWSGGTTLMTGTLEPGLAGLITVNPALLSSVGGNPMLLRDGGINGAPYIHNTTPASGYTDLLNSYLDGMQADMAFDPAAQLDDNTSLMAYSTDSVGWLEEYRSNATKGSEAKTAMLLRAKDAYSSVTGVSLDEELALLLDVEQSYKAASKVLSAVDEMLQSLIAAAG